MVVLSGDVSICDDNVRLKEEKDLCLKLAKEGKDISKINSLQEEVRSRFGGSFSVFYRAALLGNEESCQEMLELGCYAQYYNLLVILTQNVSLCDKITANSEEREECRTNAR